MAEYLSDGWLAAVVELGAALPERPGFDLVVGYEIAGAPDGKVRYSVTWRDGRPTGAAAGKNAEADTQIVMKYADAVRVVGGELPRDVAYMQGRYKVDGDYAAYVYGFRELLDSPEHVAYEAAIADATDFA